MRRGDTEMVNRDSKRSDKFTSVSMPLNDFTLDVLQALRLMPRVSAKNMFGGAGIYCDGIFFGLTAFDKFFLRVDETTRSKFVDAGMSYFEPWPGHSMTNYYEVPPHIFRRPEELCGWANEALDIARLSKKSKTKRIKRSKKAKPKGLVKSVGKKKAARGRRKN